MRNILTIVILAVVALSSGCASTRSGGGVESEVPVSIVWHQVDDPHMVCQQRSGTSLFKIKGCSHWTDEKIVVTGTQEKGQGRVCHIWTKKPESSKDIDRFTTLGHEVMHCFEGNWHDQYGRYNENWHKPKS